MVLRMMGGLILIITLIGCSLTQKPSPTSELQIKVAQLENKIEERDQEITDLKDEVSELGSQMENMSNPQMNTQTEDPVESDSSSVKAETGLDQIIKVAVTPKELQKALQQAGYYDGAIDGKIGKKTKKSIEQFQKDHKLAADGVVGKKTWAELKTYLKVE